MANIAINALKPRSIEVDLFIPGTNAFGATPITEFPLPDGSVGPARLYMVGRSSPQWLDFMKEHYDENLTNKDLFGKTNPRAHELIAKLIVGWLDNGAFTEPYSYEAALDLLKNPENVWIMDQLQSKFLDEAAYFQPISTSS